MLEIPVVRWGKEYESMSKMDVVHFETGETLARVHEANGGLIKMDMKKAKKAREILRQFSIQELVDKCAVAGELYENATLPLGNGEQDPDSFCNMQSATTGLPEHMCRFNMTKNAFVMKHMGEILNALTRGLPYDILTNGYGMEDRGVMVSYQANCDAAGWVLPSNSPGVHTLWLPVIPLQMGLVLKPGPAEPWTPYRMYEAFAQAGIPREAFCLYPGGADKGAELGGAVLESCERSVIFGGLATIERYHGNPRISAHGPGFSKIILGDDVVDDWEKYLDIMVDSVYVNSGRSCISCSGIWASRHTAEIADAMAQRLGPIAPLPMNDPNSGLAAFTMPGAAKAMNGQIDDGCKSGAVTEATSKYRGGDRLVENERCDFLRPTVLHVSDADDPMANTEFMFPFCSVVECPQDKMISKIGYTLVGSCITEDETFSRQLLDATNIDRLNIGEVKTLQLNWLQPHEGNIIDFLFRARAFQNSPPPPH